MNTQLGGLKEGDFIVEMSGIDVKWFTQQQLVKLIQSAKSSLVLKVITPIDRNYLKVSCNQLGDVRSQFYIDCFFMCLCVCVTAIANAINPTNHCGDIQVLHIDTINGLRRTRYEEEIAGRSHNQLEFVSSIAKSGKIVLSTN